MTRAFTLIELLVVISVIVILVGIVLAVGAALGSGSAVSQTRNTMTILETALNEWENQANRQLTWGINGQPNPPGTAVYDIHPDTPHVFLISELLATVGRMRPGPGVGRSISANSEVAAVLAQIDQDTLLNYKYSTNLTAPEWLRDLRRCKDNPQVILDPDPQAQDWVSLWDDWDGFSTVLDAWDRPIRMIHPGRVWVAGPPYNDLSAGIDRDDDGTIRTELEAAYGICINRRPFFVSSGPDFAFGHINPTGTCAEEMLEASQDNIYSYEPLKEVP